MNEKWKALYGFCLLLSIVGLAAAIAIGHVEEKTSYGLHDILTALFVLSGGWASWAFGASRNNGSSGG